MIGDGDGDGDGGATRIMALLLLATFSTTLKWHVSLINYRQTGNEFLLLLS